MPRQKAPDGETPDERFRRLGKYRVGRVLDDIRVVENLSRSSGWTAAEAAHIVNAIRERTDQLEAAFANPRAPRATGFTFGDE